MRYFFKVNEKEGHIECALTSESNAEIAENSHLETVMKEL